MMKPAHYKPLPCNAEFRHPRWALIVTLILSILIGMVHVADASGKQGAWRAAISDSREFLVSEQYREAETAAKKAVRLAHRRFGPASPQMADTLLLLSNIFVRQRMFAKAEPLQRQSLNIMEKRLGMNHPDLVKYLNPLVVTCARQDRYEAAEHFHTRILNISKKVHGDDHPETRKARHYLNTLRLSRDKKAQTDSNEKEATLLSVQTPSESDPTSLSNEKWQTLTDRMAELADQGHHQEGFAAAMEAAHLAETALGPDHPRVAEALTQAAGFLEQMDESEEAMRLYAKAFEVLERAYGGDSIEASIGLDRMARLYESQENYAGAAAMAERSMVIWKDNFGADHPTVKSRMKNLEILKKKALQNQTPAIAETPPKASPPPPLKRAPKTAVSPGDKTRELGQAFAQTRSRIERAIRDLPRSLQLDRFTGNWQTRFDRFLHHFTVPQWILILMGIGGVIFLLRKDWN